MLDKHVDGFPEEARLSLLGNEGRWFEKGSILYQSHLELKQLHDSWTVKTIYVGKPTCGYSAPAELVQGSFEVIPLMLYAMALECWLKGLMVMAMPRESEATKKKIHDLVDELVSGKVEEDDVHIQAILNALRQPEIANLSAIQRAQIRSENRERFGALRGHNNHRLVPMFEAATQTELFGELKEWIDRLDSFIMMGRYPSLLPNNKELYPWYGLLQRDDLFEAVNDAVYKRYESLLHTEL